MITFLDNIYTGFPTIKMGLETQEFASKEHKVMNRFYVYNIHLHIN